MSCCWAWQSSSSCIFEVGKAFWEQIGFNNYFFFVCFCFFERNLLWSHTKKFKVRNLPSVRVRLFVWLILWNRPEVSYDYHWARYTVVWLHVSFSWILTGHSNWWKTGKFKCVSFYCVLKEINSVWASTQALINPTNVNSIPDSIKIYYKLCEIIDAEFFHFLAPLWSQMYVKDTRDWLCL